MTHPTLICGSLAFDKIMQYHGRFGDTLLADQLHRVNVSFLVPTLRTEYGGCSANIAYNLKLLGGEPLPEKRHIFWNFVSSSLDRIEQAKEDWREQRFACVPEEHEFIPLPA